MIEEEKTEAIKEYWELYKKTGQKDSRDQLIIYYAPLVKFVVGRLAARLPSSVDINDLISYGMFGLIDAIDKFDLTREVKFETYAITRIRGAVIDELRALDWVPRSVRQKAKDIERAYVEMEHKLSRTPTDEEVAENMGITVDEYSEMLGQISNSNMLALEDIWRPGSNQEDTVMLIDTIEDKNSIDPSESLELADLKSSLAAVIKELPEKEQTVIALYYFENLTLKEIGEILEVTESRISQLHTKAIIRLKTKLKLRSGL